MYKSIFYDRKDNLIHIWDDKKGYFTEDYRKYEYCYIESQSGEYKSMFGHKLNKIKIPSFQDRYDVYFESDVNPEVKYLLDNYLDSDDVSTDTINLYFDIEVEMITGRPNMVSTKNMITSIAAYDTLNKIFKVFIISKKNDINVEKKNVELNVYPDEKSMLIDFIDYVYNLSPTIITGWNIDYFDIPYLYNRSKRLLSNYADKLSPIKKVKSSNKGIVSIAGVSNLDYMQLYKKFTNGEIESYSLDFVSKLELGRGKIEYSANLDELLERDINKFIEYNIVDVELVLDLEQKLKFIELARQVCHTCHVPYNAVIHSSRFIEGAILTYLHRQGLVAPDVQYFKPMKTIKAWRGSTEIKVDTNIDTRYPTSGRLIVKKSKSSETELEYTSFQDNVFVLSKPLEEAIDSDKPASIKLIGGYVKDPQVGLHEWVYSLDLRSLYPSIIRTLGISPETKVGKVLNWRDVYMMKYFNRDERVNLPSYKDVVEYKNNFDYIPPDFEIIIETKSKDILTINKVDFVKLMNDDNLTIAANGVIYNNTSRGVIPQLIDIWFEKRLEYRKKMEEVTSEEERNFYDQRQWVQKIFMNSIYGVMGLHSFRFFDIDNAEAITMTAQDTNRFAEVIVNEHYIKKYNYDGNPTIYGDTDSIYVKFDEVDVAKGMENMLSVSSEICSSINNALEIYSNLSLNSTNNFLMYNREKICRRGLWADAKKRYAVWVKNNEGKECDYTTYVGIDTQRSSFPKKFKIILAKVLDMILYGKSKDDINTYLKSIEETIRTSNLVEISKVSSVKTMDEYSKHIISLNNFKSGVPQNSKAAILYNQLLTHFKCEYKYEPIRVGDKVRMVYLKQNPLRIDMIAFKHENNPDVIMDYIEKYVDKTKMFDRELNKKIQGFYNVLGWGNSNNKVVQNFF